MPSIRLVPPTEWPTLGWQVVSWCEYYLCHGPGDIQGDELIFDDEFAQFFLDCYRVFPKRHKSKGRRVVTLAEISRAKGRAKSELAGAFVCAELLGPVRFDHWAKAGEVSEWGYEYEEGEPVGRPVKNPFIRCLATEENQAGNTYDNVRVMLEHAAATFGGVFARLDIGRTRILVDGGRAGEVRPSTAGAASKDGGKETFAVADEDHLYYLPELKDMFRMVMRNLRKRHGLAQTWMLCTTTQFQPGQGSVAEDHRKQAEKIVEGGKKRRQFGFCWDHREGHKVKNWHDDAEVLRSLEEAYGEAATWMDLESILFDEIRAPGSTQADGERYFCNRSTTGHGKAVNVEKWKAMADPKRTPTTRVRVVLGFDGSDGGVTKNPDDTALIAWTVEKRPHLFLINRWHKPDGMRGPWKVPRREVRSTMTATKEALDVGRLVADPPGWRDEIDHREHGWKTEFGKDAKDEDIVIEFPTNSPKRMDAAIDRILEAIDEQSFTHDGSDELTEYALNAMLTTAAGRSQYKALVKESETSKIDGFVAAAIAYHELQYLPIVEPPKTPKVHSWDDILAELDEEAAMESNT